MHKGLPFRQSNGSGSLGFRGHASSGSVLLIDALSSMIVACGDGDHRRGGFGDGLSCIPVAFLLQNYSSFTADLPQRTLQNHCKTTANFRQIFNTGARFIDCRKGVDAENVRYPRRASGQVQRREGRGAATWPP